MSQTPLRDLIIHSVEVKPTFDKQSNVAARTQSIRSTVISLVVFHLKLIMNS